MTCPHCRQPLMRDNRTPYRVWTCRRCGGCAATLGVLRKGMQHQALQQAWARTIGTARNSLLRCPSCSATMCRVPTDGPEIDLCRCQLIWFDAGELEAMPQRSAESIEAERKAERWAEEMREWKRRQDADADFAIWRARHPFRVWL